jgi:hypothetical protein
MLHLSLLGKGHSMVKSDGSRNVLDKVSSEARILNASSLPDQIEDSPGGIPTYRDFLSTGKSRVLIHLFPKS